MPIHVSQHHHASRDQAKSQTSLSEGLHCCPTSDQRHDDIPRCRPYELQGLRSLRGVTPLMLFFKAGLTGPVVPYRRHNGNMARRRYQTRRRRCSCRHGTGHDVAMITRICISVQFLRHKLVRAALSLWIDSSTSIIRRCQTEK